MLGEDEARHARDVLRLSRGDEVYVFDGAGREFRCVLREIASGNAGLDLLEEVEPARPESPLHLTLGVALPKGTKFDLVAQKATELGVSRILPLVTTRADVRLGDRGDAERKAARWRRIAIEAAKQCGRARLMEIGESASFESVVQREERPDELRLMFAERDGSSFAELMSTLQSGPTQVMALVGSEGGWTDEEIGQARAGRWKIVTLGGRTLRAETAAIVVAALLQHRLGDLV